MEDILKRNEQSENLTQHIPEEKNKDFNTNQISPEDLDSRWLRWKCLVCGYLYEGVTKLKVCPKCGNQDPDKFDDAE